jgi:hypothetical protein
VKRPAPLTICLTAIAAISAPALAVPAHHPADNLSKGCDFYKKGQYTQALPYLQDTVSKNPRQWAGHYYLGHEFMALGQQTEAYEQYNLCRSCRPPAGVMTSCTDMLNRIYASSRSTAHPAGVGPARQLSPEEQNLLVQRRQVIMNEANERASRGLTQTQDEVATRTNRNGGVGLESYWATGWDKKDAHNLKIQNQQRNDAIQEEARIRAHKLTGY